MQGGREPAARAALMLLDEVGLEGLTLRGIAARLGVQAPTLYWRFHSKQDLVDEMATQILVDLHAERLAASWPASWPEMTRQFGRGLRAALLGHRDGARLVAGTRLRDPSVYASMEDALQVFVAAGIAPEDAAACLKTVNDYVIGFTIEQQAVTSPSGEPNPGYDMAQRDAATTPYPLTRRIGKVLFGDYDAMFERGLALIIAGFAAGLVEAPSSPPYARSRARSKASRGKRSVT